MRRLTLPFLPALVVVACSGGPPTRSPTPMHDQFYSVDFISPDVGWAAGADGIFATKDGGAHWAQQYHTPAFAVGGTIDFLDARVGFAFLERTLISTNDGGAHWAVLSPERSPDQEDRPWQIDFVTPDTWWAIAVRRKLVATRTLVRTSDGGETYAEAASAVDSVCFSDEHNGWYAGAIGVMHTADGGATWSRSLSSPPMRRVEWKATVDCSGANVAWALFTGGGAPGSQLYALYRTRDGGAHWAAVAQAPDGPDVGAHVAAGSFADMVAVLDEKNAWFIGSCLSCDFEHPMLIEATGDGGLAWGAAMTILPAGRAYPYDLQFVDPRHGWLATSNGIFATADGGRTWVKQR